MRINKDSWNIIQRVIRRYPETKKKYKDAFDAAMYPNGDKRKHPEPEDMEDMKDYTKPVSITEAAAIRLSSPYVSRLKKEIDAVEKAFITLDEEDQKLIHRRYWSNKDRNIPFLKILDVPVSEPTMKRRCRRFIIMVGKNLGEIDSE